jgi:hypothetical protein
MQPLGPARVAMAVAQKRTIFKSNGLGHAHPPRSSASSQVRGQM